MKNKADQLEQDLFRMAQREKMILPETVYKEVDDKLSEIHQAKRLGRMTWKRAVILAAALVAMCSLTVTAAVGALQRRMEAMNEREMEDYFVQIYTSRLGADNYSRPLTDAERERMDGLRTSYEEEAVFPEKILTMISSPEEYSGKGVAFYKDTSTFFLPEESMSDEELLEVIDFVYKRDYSLQAMNQKIEEGEISFPAQQIAQQGAQQIAGEEAAGEEETATGEETAAASKGTIQNPGQELTIPYTGDLAFQYIASGQNCIYLAGESCIHRMKIGSSDSELFFDGFEKETYVNAMYEDKKGNLYLGLNVRMDENDDSADSGITIGGVRYKTWLWILNADREVIRKVDIASLLKQEYGVRSRMITRIVVDEQGYVYVRAAFLWDVLLLVLDEQGNYIRSVTSEEFNCHDLGGLGIGKDGRVYTQIQTKNRMGIASVDPVKGSLDQIYMDIVPEGTIMLDIVAPGSDTDFVFWGYDGIFTYNLGEDKALNVLPAYEAPCNWEGVMYCALPDGRIVFADCSQYSHEGEKIKSVPENITFYYKSTLTQG